MICLKSFEERIAARDPDRQTAEIHIRIALLTASRPSAPPRSSAWPDANRERASHASRGSYATEPRNAIIYIVNNVIG